MNPDGNDPVNLTRDAASDFKPTWSPTGEQILFVSFREGGESLYLMDADGSNIRRVLDNWHSRSNATWSPDGKRIASVSDAVLYIATIDGKSVEPVAQTGFESVGDPARKLPSFTINQNKVMNFVFSTLKRSNKLFCSVN